MGVLRDIVDTAKEIDIKGATNNYFNNKRYSSISKRGSEGVLQFPVLVSKSLDIDTLQMVTKALERQYSTFVQIIISMNPVMYLDKDRDIVGYLKQFHQNSDVKFDSNDVLNAASNLKENCTFWSSDDEKNVVLAFTYEGVSRSLLQRNKDLLQSTLDNIITECLNNKYIPEGNYKFKFKDAEKTKYLNTLITEAQGLKQNREPSAQEQSRKNDLPMGRMLTDNDVKKANELIPTTLHVKVKVVNKDQNDVGFHDFIIGIKSTMHPIKSDEMIKNLVNGSKSNNKFFDFIRWTTGEINFLKDFLLNINEIKDDVINRSSGSSPWWITLKRRKSLSTIRNALGLTKQILPNATIVISAEEAEYIKINHGFDLMSEQFVDKLMKTFFLLGFVIVDNSTQIAHFLFDGQQSFQSITFKSLERENTNKANDFKEMLKLVNRI